MAVVGIRTDQYVNSEANFIMTRYSRPIKFIDPFRREIRQWLTLSCTNTFVLSEMQVAKHENGMVNNLYIGFKSQGDLLMYKLRHPTVITPCLWPSLCKFTIFYINEEDEDR